MDTPHSHKRFLWILSAVFLLVCMLGAGFNYLADPYGLFGTHRKSGFNELKPAAPERVRVTKPYMASRAKPRVVIGGNSRPEMGLDPQSTCWEATDQPVFNTGIPGAGMYMQTRYLEHAVEAGGARRVLLGVDFLDFLVDVSTPTGEIDWARRGAAFEGRLVQPGQTGSASRISLQTMEDKLGGLFSLVALGDSIRTVMSQRDGHSSTRREDGFNPGLDYWPIIRNEGQAVLFTQKNQELWRILRRSNLGVLEANGQRTVPLEALRRFLDWADARNVEVVLFINPYHSEYLIQIELAGRWSQFETWKRQLAIQAREYAVPLWDFNTIDAYSTESAPARHDKSIALQWFWEPAHYRKELGDLMLASMLDRPCGNGAVPGSFGAKITDQSLEPHLDTFRQDKQRFMGANPGVIERLRGVAAE